MASAAGNALSLIKTVLELVADRRTGVLDVKSDGLRTQIYFDDGRPLFAEDEAPGETFGRLLVRQGVIANHDFVRVIDEMTRAAAGNDQLRFGEVAVSLGVLTPEQVEHGLGEQVCGIITRSLQRGESAWDFEPSPPAAKPPRAFSLEINQAVVAALREPADRSMLAGVVAARPEELVLVAGPRPASALGDGAGAAAAEMHAARMAAELAFQKGLALLRDSKIPSASLELARASALQPESLEYRLYATWAEARRFREIPSDPDRRTLLELAERAKRRDPLFAFGSYVIGQLSMWAGDDVAAKRWFYEALRLDPASEAGQQVRILARRGAAPAPAAEAGGPAAPDEQATGAPVSAHEPPVPAVPGDAPAKPPSRRWAGRLVSGAALLGTAALVIFVGARLSAPRAGLAPSVPSVAEPSLGSMPAVDSERKDAPAPPVKTALEAPSAKSPADARLGTVLFPARASAHRIFVDGRRGKTDGIAPLHLRCGSHVIQIGSGGTPETVELPCGGEVQLH